MKWLPNLALLMITLGTTVSQSKAIAPEYTIKDGAVKLQGVGPDNPVIYDNDWWFDGRHVWSSGRRAPFGTRIPYSPRNTSTCYPGMPSVTTCGD
jgi:hypothetical protein